MTPTTSNAKEPNVNKKRIYPDIDSCSLRQRVFKELDKNPKLKPKMLVTILSKSGFEGLNYRENGQTVRQYKADWKRQYKSGVALNGLNFHKCRCWVYVPGFVDRGKALGRGCSVKGSATGVVCWRPTKMRNRAFVFDCRAAELGRLEWFETGRVNVWVKSPASWGKVKQLLSYGFFVSGLIGDVRVFDLWVETVKFKGAELTVDVGVRVPYFKVDVLKESNGVTVLGGDESHPTCIEIPFGYPDWAERNERLLEESRRVNADLVRRVDALTEDNISLRKTLGVLIAKLSNVDVPSEVQGSKGVLKGQDYAV
jgi:hypothetical protein